MYTELLPFKSAGIVPSLDSSQNTEQQNNIMWKNKHYYCLELSQWIYYQQCRKKIIATLTSQPYIRNHF